MIYIRSGAFIAAARVPSFGVCFLLRCGGERRTVLLHMHRRRFCRRASVTAVAAVFVLAAFARAVTAADAPVAGPRAPADIDPAGIVFFPY